MGLSPSSKKKKEATVAKGNSEAMENWIILDELNDKDFSFKEKMNKGDIDPVNTDDYECEWDDFDM